MSPSILSTLKELGIYVQLNVDINIKRLWEVLDGMTALILNNSLMKES